MRDTLNIECLVQSFENVVTAKQEHDKARDSYDGYSWGYYGRRYVEEMEAAAEDLQKRLDEYIEDKVRAILTEVTTK